MIRVSPAAERDPGVSGPAVRTYQVKARKPSVISATFHFLPQGTNDSLSRAGGAEQAAIGSRHAYPFAPIPYRDPIRGHGHFVYVVSPVRRSLGRNSHFRIWSG